MKYLIYCRKSTDTEDKQVQSLESQEKELIKLAKALNLEVVATLKESRSAKSLGRPVFAEMMKMINSGKVDGILCWKLDRLARNFVDGGLIIDSLQKSVIREIRTFEGVHYPSDNVLMLAMQFGMANQYSRDLSTNVKRGNRTKLENGDWPNQAPLGYLNDRLAKKIIIDPIRSKYIIRAFELFKTGKYGYRDLATVLYDEGFRSRGSVKVPKSKIQQLLSNPFYYGLMRMGEKLYKGNHKPLITKTLFDAVQETMEERLHPRKRTLMFPIRGLAKCAECGCIYTASRKKGHDYYYCTNGKGICTSDKKYLREKDLYNLLLPILEKLSFDEEEIELMYLSAKEDLLNESGRFDETLDQLKNEEISVSERQNKLLDVFLDGSITKETHEQKNLLLENQKANIKKQIEELESKKKMTVATLEPVKKLFLACNIWAKQFLSLPPEEKQNIAHEVLWNLSMSNKKIISYQMKSPYSAIAKLPENASFSERLGD